MKWVCGLTTVPIRRETYLPKTLASIEKAGFPNPRLFVDGCSDKSLYEKFGLSFVLRHDAIRTFGNWFLGLAEIYIREPQADRYVMFQDDFVAYRNLRSYLEVTTIENKVYWNLLSHKNTDTEKPPGYIGFYKPFRDGKGAVANVFTNDAVQKLLSSNHMFVRPKSVRGYEKVDGGIWEAMQIAGYSERVHYPSLIDHIGVNSSMRHGTYSMDGSFRGEEFDAMSMLDEKPAQEISSIPSAASSASPGQDYTPILASLGLGDILEQALEKIGVTKDRVEQWLGRPCNGCTERKRRLNRLGWHVQQIMKYGKIEESKARFDEMLDD